MSSYRTLDAWATYGPMLPNQYLRLNWWRFTALASGLVHSSHREG